MYKFVAVIERTDSGTYGGYFPALPGTGATGATRDEVVEALRGVLVMHLHGMQEDGDAIPDSDDGAEVIEVGEEEVRSFVSDPLPSSSATAPRHSA
jgi:predicted RNase H-like HicB family nuclease